MLTVKEDELVQTYFSKIYQPMQGPVYSAADLQSYSKDNVSITYGELLYPSVKKIIHEMKLQKEDIFLDLGSGMGKCALQIFMQTPVQKVIGIEASVALHDQAQRAKAQLQNDFPKLWDQRELNFIAGNFLKEDWQQATVAYTCSTCFTRELLDAIGEKVNQATHIQQLLSLRPIPTLTRLRLKKVFRVECSWDSALCFLYSVSR